MKRIFGILFLVLVAICATPEDAKAQCVEKKCVELASRSMDGAMVQVNESSSVRSAVTTIESRTRRREVEGYRVVIFSDNGQYAGDNARQVLETFKKSYPHINAYMVYESPYFKVSVGDCLTLEEASHLMAQLEGEYRELFPKREVIKFSDLGNVRPRQKVVTDTLSTL